MNLWRAVQSILGMIVASALVSSHALAQDAEEPPECYDAIVLAKIVKQTPSVFPNCGDDCIVMVWPWFLQLDVKRVVEGQAAKGLHLTLAMQHTSFRKDLGRRRWWLRRNSLGGFNVLRFGDDTKPARCASGISPANPYIRPSPDKTLQDLLRDGQAAYDHP